MSQKCSECGRESPLGQPLGHFVGCEAVQKIIAHMKKSPHWDGKTFDEELHGMLRELQQPASHGAGVSK